MAEQGIIPRKLARVPPPKCPSCLYGKAHRKPWRTHKIDPKIKPSTVPGAVVSIDQLESPVLGFVPIAKGQPTVHKYRGDSVFVDHASDFTYVHMHQHLTMDETIDAKHAFECLAEQHGVRILHYHCDNGRFADKAFVDDVRAAHQTITFCSIGAHHQNGIAERRIRDITENARKSLLHAAHRWPKAIASNLWPQAIKHVVNVRNSLPRPGKTESPLSKFSGMSVQPNLKHFHPFLLCLVAQSTFSRHLFKQEAHSQSGENAPELASSYAIHLIMHPPSCSSCQPIPSSLAHNSTVFSMMTLTQ